MIRNRIQRELNEEFNGGTKMAENKRRGLTTMWALLILPATALGGGGLAAWKLRADDPGQTLQQLREELDQSHKTEAEIKKKLEQAVEARLGLERAREETLAVEQKSRRSAEDAKEVLAFLRDNVFLAPGRPKSWSGEGLGKDVTLRKAVDVAASKLGGLYKDRPSVEAAIREILGASYQALGEAQQAVKHYELAFALRDSVLGPDHTDTCECRNKLAVALRDAGRTDEASRLYEMNSSKHDVEEAMRGRAPARGQNPALRTKGVKN